jgi:hypothetical protein
MQLMPIPITGESINSYYYKISNIYFSTLFSLSTMQGVMAIPSFFLFHNGKAAARYNETEYKVDLFSSFITRYTGKNRYPDLTQQ